MVEIVLAVGIAAFCLVVIIGLIPTGINTNQGSIEQTAAVGIAQAVMTDLRSTPLKANAKSPRFGLTIGNAAGQLTKPETIYVSEDGTTTLVGAAPYTSSTGSASDGGSVGVSRYRVSLDFTDPPASPQKGATRVHLLITWPALADRDPTTAPLNYSGSYEIVTALDRN